MKKRGVLLFGAHFFAASSPSPSCLQRPESQSALFSQSAPTGLSGGAVHLLSLHLPLLHSSPCSQSSPASLPSSLPPPPPPPFRHASPAGPSGQSPVSLHCFGGCLFGRCAGSPLISRLILTMYGLFLLPPPAMLSPWSL